MEKPGPVSKADDDILDWCVEMRVRHGWDYKRIAQGLLDVHKIGHRDDPGRPVHQTTVMRYLRKAAKRLEQQKYYDQSIQRILQVQHIESLTEMFYKLLEENEVQGFREKLEWGRFQLDLNKRLADLLDLNLKRERAEVKHTGRFDERPPPQGAVNFLPDLQRRVRDNMS